MKHLAWMGGLFVVGWIALWRVMAGRAERAEAEIAALKQTTEHLSSNAARGAEVPRRVVLEPPSPGAAADPQAASPSGPRPPSAATPPTSRGTEYADMRAYYQTSLEAQSVDVNWSRDAARNVRGIFDQVGSPGTKVTSVDCRQTICRAELTHASDGDAHTFMQKWAYSGPRLNWKGPISGGVVGSEADGTVHTVLFFAREGTDLPTLN